VRRLVFGVAAGSIGLYGRRFLVTRPGMPPVWSLMLGPHASFLTLPIGRDRLYCYADCRDGDPPPPLRELLAGFAEPAIPVLDAFDDAGGVISHGGWVEEVTLDSWARGDVLLIGDAAHATSPNMAQGAAMAFEDALVLAQALTAAAGIRDGLQIYERRRRPRTDWVLQQTRRRDRTRALPDTVRNVVLRRLGRRIHYGNFRPLLRPA
jgi:2-polyprenyl-6-methoxyphenol hydroxylase-like FAD-dependent oxidoreductase